MPVSSNLANVELSRITSGDAYLGYFVNNGSNVMAVDGSSTEVRFELNGLDPEQKLIINRVDYALSSNSDVLVLENFADLPALANGVRYMSSDEDIPFDIKDNGDFLLAGTDAFFDNFVQFLAPNGGSLIGSIDYPVAFGGNGLETTAGELSVTVRDDLSSIAFFRMACKATLLK